MRFIEKGLLALLILSSTAPARAQLVPLPTFATKQAVENIRFMSLDGRTTYSQKTSGGLNLVGSFTTTEVVSRPADTNYLVHASPARRKVVVEVEEAWHRGLDLTKLHEILVGPFGGKELKPMGRGRASRLHLNDEWLSWYDPKDKAVHVQKLDASNRHWIIRLGRKHNPFFTPDVVVLNSETVLYTDVNDKGVSALLAFTLADAKVTVVRKAASAGTRMEVCRRGDYVALGEFPYDGVPLGSSIHVMAWKGPARLGGFAKLYDTPESDLGQMVCGADKVWFVKTVAENRSLNDRLTEAANLRLPDGKLTVATNLDRVANLVEMDGRVLLPWRETTYVLEGDAGSRRDDLERPEGAQPRRAP